jgi:hypothetical protein
MFQQNNNSNESVLVKQRLSVKSSSKVIEATKNATQHTTSNLLRNKIKNETEATCNSPISYLKRDVFGYYIFSQLV